MASYRLFERLGRGSCIAAGIIMRVVEHQGLAQRGCRGAHNRALWLALAVLPWVAACSRSHSAAGASQVVAKVNKSEITVLQLNSALSRIPNLTPDTTKTASKQVLEQLIDEELLVDRARQAKLDRNPGVLQAIEAAKRNVLATAYLQQSVGQIPEPSQKDIAAFYAQHPEYFSARRIYTYRSIPIQAPPAQAESIQQQLVTSKNVDALLANLKASSTPFVVNQLTKGAEQLPSSALAKMSTLKDGDIITMPFSGGVEVVQLLSSSSEPVDEAQAKPSIEKYLIEQARKQRIDQEVQSLRASASIQYVGDFTPSAALSHAPAAAAPAKRAESDTTAGIGAGIK
jgi:EpsD family peptidyl-prolyl cis-trans isomerase